MKRSIVFILCLSFSSVSHAQVTRYLGTKGERVDFDTAVIISLPAYRKDLRAVQAKDSVIDTLQSLYMHEKNRNTIMASQAETEPVKAEMAAPPPVSRAQPVFRRWYFNPLLYLAAGLLLGVYLVD